MGSEKEEAIFLQTRKVSRLENLLAKAEAWLDVLNNQEPWSKSLENQILGQRALIKLRQVQLDRERSALDKLHSNNTFEFRASPVAVPPVRISCVSQGKGRQEGEI